ncbi:transcription factor Sp4-like [Galendromus occidentalis]|uniref:Transcription factor Sp4-like n=1 Tax=Galendromus occidentalis TaxID=34638 RepID=A0AAJ7SG89_9ACAR|nr:transcription factor Sp4-like [Galendromus occidentalis]
MNEESGAAANQTAATQAAGQEVQGQIQALIQNAGGATQIVNGQGLTYNVIPASASAPQIQNIQIDGQEAIFIPAALTNQAGQLVRNPGGSPQAYQNVTIRNGNSIQTIQVPVAAPAMQQTTIPMQIPVQTPNGQTILQTVHVPVQTLGMGGMSNVLGQPMLHQLAGLTQPQLTQLQVQSTSPTASSSVASSQNTVTSVNQSQAQTVQSATGVQSISVPQVQQVQSVQSVQQWAADAATAAALAQAQQQTVALQLPNGQIVHGQQVNLGMFSAMVYPGAMNMAQLTGLRSPNVIQIGNINGVPVQIQSAAANQQVIQGTTLQALGLQAGSLSPLQTIQLAGNGQQIVAQQIQQDPNDPSRWQVVNIGSTAQATAQAPQQAATPTVTVQATPIQAANATTISNGESTATTGGGEQQQIVLVSGDVQTNGTSTASITPVSTVNGTPLATGERRLRRVACTCPNCRDSEGHRTLRPNGETPGRRQHICHMPGCNKVYGKTSHLRAHLRWHAGERPFVCDWLFCGKGFTRSDELQRHKRTHTGEKRFQCAECLKGFMRSDHLSKHLKTHIAKKSGLAIEGGDSDIDQIESVPENGTGHPSIVTVSVDGSDTQEATIMHVVKHEDGRPLQISDGTRIHDVVQIHAEDGTTQLQIVKSSTP